METTRQNIINAINEIKKESPHFKENLNLMYGNKFQWLKVQPLCEFTEEQIDKAMKSDDGYLGMFGKNKCFVHKHLSAFID